MHYVAICSHRAGFISQSSKTLIGTWQYATPLVFFSQEALEFVKAFFRAGKPVAAICHGPQILIDAGVANGRRMTSYEAIQTDFNNAGAEWVDDEVVLDNGLVNSRKPDDTSDFNPKMIEETGEGLHDSNRIPEFQGAAGVRSR